MTNLISEDYLIHYGVKGMKWGVRHDPEPAKINKIGTRLKSNKNYTNIKKGVKIAGKVLLAAGVVGAATVVGLEAYKFGHMNADMIIRKGTQIQSIAPSEKNDWDKTFYAAVGKDDKRKILKTFSSDTSRRAKKLGLSGEVRANIFENGETERIAGLKNMRKAYKSINNGSSKGFRKFAMTYGAKTEEQRKPFMAELNKRGYSGFRDIDGMAKWWGGKTPIILNGKSSFKLTKNPVVHIDKLSGVPVRNIEGRMQKVSNTARKTVTKSVLSATVAEASLYADNKIQEKKNQKQFK